ncbi:MAG: phosphatidate cytidylyltransferase [Bradymonadaceae bacterium]|nr:phosphatidate cytidylyltransferase [Lujinxingiaceae bacterium]
MAPKKSDLIPRVITALVALPLLLALIFLAPAWAFFCLIAAAAAVGIWEYCSIAWADQHDGAKVVTVVVGLALISVLYFFESFFIEALAGSVLVMFLFFLFFYRDQSRVTQQLGASLTAILYAGFLLTTIALFGRDEGVNGPFWIVLLLVVVWSSDTGAYFTGVTIGKRKLYPAVSPNKSVEGAIGGLVSSIAAAFLVNYLYARFTNHWVALEVWQVLLLAIPANLLGQMGDLAESLVKRCHAVKDSGSIIYGHGGILDRIDALFFAAPWFYIFISRILV